MFSTSEQKRPRSSAVPGRNGAALIFLLVLFALLLSLGLFFKGWPGFLRLIKETGKDCKGFEVGGRGGVALNMAFVGLMALAFVLISGGPLNGPVLGSIITAMGFTAAGLHPKNFLPVMLGLILFALLSQEDLSSTGIQIAVIFAGVALAPMAGDFGFAAGLFSGFLHGLFVIALAAPTGGFNLYNNGFAAGLAASFLYPLLEGLRARRGKGE